VAKAVRVRVSSSAPKLNCSRITGDANYTNTSGNRGEVGADGVKRYMSNLEQYLPVLLFIFIGLAVGIGPMLIGKLLGPSRPNAAKNSPYECGFEAFEDARMQFDIRYYLVAILFILFDLEVAFFFPWALVFQSMSAQVFWPMMVFILILLVAFIYEWKKGALDWE
jgi:NADH-quinone oxidoreductase subunit A